MKVKFDWSDIGFIALAEPDDYNVKFIVYELYGTDTNGLPLYIKNNAINDYTEELREAKVFLDGNVKWDGCMNYKFGGGCNVYEHVCSRGDIKDVADMLLRCYDLGERLCSHWEG